MSDDINNIEYIKAAVLHGDLSDACLGAGLPAAIALPAPIHIKAATGLFACASGMVANAIYNFGKEEKGFVVQEIKNITFDDHSSAPETSESLGTLTPSTKHSIPSTPEIDERRI